MHRISAMVIFFVVPVVTEGAGVGVLTVRTSPGTTREESIGSLVVAEDTFLDTSPPAPAEERLMNVDTFLVASHIPMIESESVVSSSIATCLGITSAAVSASRSAANSEKVLATFLPCVSSALLRKKREVQKETAQTWIFPWEVLFPATMRNAFSSSCLARQTGYQGLTL